MLKNVGGVLEVEARLTMADFGDAEHVFLSARERSWRRLQRTVIFSCGFLLPVSLMVDLFARFGGPGWGSVAFLAGVWLLLPLVAVYCIRSYYFGRVTLYCEFDLQGWRYEITCEKGRSEPRDWQAMIGWLETPGAFHLAYLGKAPSWIHRCWFWLNQPLLRLRGVPPLYFQAVVPKRCLSAEQTDELRLLLAERVSGDLPTGTSMGFES